MIFSSSEELKPAEEAAKATMAPTMGLRPTAAKEAAPSGIRMTYTASEAIEPVTPASATMKVSKMGDFTFARAARIAAPMRPEYSATATPSIHTKIKPTGAKLVKLVTASEIICWRYSAVARFSTAIISPVAGSVACIPMAEPIHDETTMTPARTTKSQKGLGSILPTRSRVARKPPGCSPFACDDGVFTAVSDMIRSLRLGGGVGVTGICGQD